jgi:hypothetical protein
MDECAHGKNKSTQKLFWWHILRKIKDEMDLQKLESHLI